MTIGRFLPRDDRRAALRRLPTASAGLRRGARPAIEQIAASVAGRPASVAELCAGQRNALSAAALSIEASPSAGLRRGTRPAIEQIAAAVTGGAAADLLLRARQRNAVTPVGGAALGGDSAAAARERRWASTAVDRVAAAVAGRTAADVLGGATRGGAHAAVRRATMAKNASAAAGLAGRTGPAVDRVATAVARRSAADVLRHA